MNTDDEDAEEMQQSLMEEVEEIILFAEYGLMVGEDESDISENEKENVLESYVDFSSILDLMESLYRELSVYKQQQSIDKDKMQGCMSVCNILQHNLHQFYSVLVQKKTFRIRTNEYSCLLPPLMKILNTMILCGLDRGGNFIKCGP